MKTVRDACQLQDNALSIKLNTRRERNRILQLKREMSLWPEFGWIRGNLCELQRDILQRHF
jgi:hypothetical protein